MSPIFRSRGTLSRAASSLDIGLRLGGALVLFAFGLGAAACASAPLKAKKATLDASFEDDYFGGAPDRGALTPPRADVETDDAGAFGAGERATSSDAGQGGNDRTPRDAGADTDPGERCVGPLKAGDLAVVELMIRAAEGANDRAEWLEIQNTRACELNLRGLRVASPRGDAGPGDVAEVTTDLFLPKHRMVLVASSRNPAINNNLPGALIVFPGDLSDILRNEGDTVTLTAGGLEIDRLTYPKFANLAAGRSISFPSNCAWSDRADWARWSFSFYGWAGAAKGTPNAANTDVSCR